jgi:HEPN domain-containing protein
LYLHLFPSRLEPKKENFCILPNFEAMPEEKDRDKPESGDAWLVERPNAQNNWTQAKSDFATANTLLDAGIGYAAVFFGQQTAEKALRAACIVRLQKNPRGHNIIQSANALQAPLNIMNAAAELNADFLTTRSVESAEGVPAHLYDRETAQRHLDAARSILEWVRGFM